MQLGDRLQAGHPRHRDINDREVDFGPQPELDRLGAVTGLGHDLEVGLGVEHQPQPAADQRMVVGQKDPRLQRRHTLAVTRSGLDRQVTSHPPPAVVAISSLAPINAARSRIPRIPVPGSRALKAHDQRR